MSTHTQDERVERLAEKYQKALAALEEAEGLAMQIMCVLRNPKIQDFIPFGLQQRIDDFVLKTASAAIDRDTGESA